MNWLRILYMALSALTEKAAEAAGGNLSWRKFPVGTFFLLEGKDGRPQVMGGTNVKPNAADSSTKACAEGVALGAASALRKFRRLRAIVVVGNPQPSFLTPTLHLCNQCRQMLETLMQDSSQGSIRVTKDLVIVCVNYTDQSIKEIFTLGELLELYASATTAEQFFERMRQQAQNQKSAAVGEVALKGVLKALQNEAFFRVPNKEIHIPMSLARATLTAERVVQIVRTMAHTTGRRLKLAVLPGDDLGIARLLTHLKEVASVTVVNGGEDIKAMAGLVRELRTKKLHWVEGLHELHSIDLVFADYAASESSPRALSRLFRSTRSALRDGGQMYLFDLDGGNLYTGGEDCDLPVVIDANHPHFPRHDRRFRRIKHAWVVWRPCRKQDQGWKVFSKGRWYLGVVGWPFWRYTAEELQRTAERAGLTWRSTEFHAVPEAMAIVNRALQLRANLSSMFVGCLFQK